MTISVQTPVEKLPSHQGRPVPWIARWTGMYVEQPIQVAITPEGTRAFYEDGVETRDDKGVLWVREGLMRTGKPEYAQVSAYRQRMAMRRRKCQVCGSPIEGKVIRWLIDPRQINTGRDGTKTLTMSPPTCDGCIPLTLSLCPAMKKSHVVARVLEYRIWGVWGAITGFDKETGKGRMVQKAMVDYDRTDYPFPFEAVAAKQQVVEWTKFRMED